MPKKIKKGLDNLCELCYTLYDNKAGPPLSPDQKRCVRVNIRSLRCVYAVKLSFAAFFDFLLEVFFISKELMINEDIRDKEVRVIGPNGDQLGIMSSAEALEIAAKKNLDLVKISPQANPPVCKIMDYGKYRFEMAKREKENRKNQKVVSIKEIQLTPSIDTHDFETKLRAAIKFLNGGDKVKVLVKFRGRQVQHAKLGEELLTRFTEGTADAGNVEKAPKLEGRNMAMVIAPKK